MNIEKIENSFTRTRDRKCSIAKHGMVSSAFPNATKAGIEILKKGGNAVDSACAVAIALGVCEPQASGIGGQSMVLLHINGKTISIDGSSRSPSLAHSSLFHNKTTRLVGYKASTVPSTVATIGYIHEKYGRLEWQSIIKPSIKIAKRGYKITPLQHNLQKKELQNFLDISSKSGAKYFLKDGLVPYDIGDTLIQEDLAETLKMISEYGYRSFYHGQIAKIIHNDMKKNHGLIRDEDLAFMPEPIEKPPIGRNYRKVKVMTSPPPTAGRTLLLSLMMLSYFPSKFMKDSNPEYYHFVAEIFRKAFLHRMNRPFNPSTYHQTRDNVHLSKTFAKQMANSIHKTMDVTLPIENIESEDDDTTHISVMDDEGNAVGITQSIELAFGSKTAADGLGFLYNNYMSTFEFTNPYHPFFIRPNATPWTSVSPALLFYDQKPWIMLGSPGSTRIFSAICYFISGIVDEDLHMGDSMSRPRFHCSTGGVISYEDGGLNTKTLTHLTKMGYKLSKKDRWSFYHGAIHAVMKGVTTGEFQGVAEARRDGISMGV